MSSARELKDLPFTPVHALVLAQGPQPKGWVITVPCRLYSSVLEINNIDCDCVTLTCLFHSNILGNMVCSYCVKLNKVYSCCAQVNVIYSLYGQLNVFYKHNI